MKTIYSGELKFITPAFLSGADQGTPEIRVPSIRGELRWWFRVLGATAADETAVFGGVHGGAVRSAVTIRVSNVKLVMGQDITAPQNTSKEYLYYFATVSGKTKGMRSAAGHYADVGSSFCLRVMLRDGLEPVLEKRLRDALGLFLQYGCLGLRATRGCGAFTSTNMPEVNAAAFPKVIIGKLSSESFGSGLQCQMFLGNFLQDFRRDNHLPATRKTALGYSFGAGSRFASALRIRPIEIAPGTFSPYLIYTDEASRECSVKELVKLHLEG